MATQCSITVADNSNKFYFEIGRILSFSECLPSKIRLSLAKNGLYSDENNSQIRCYECNFIYSPFTSITDSQIIIEQHKKSRECKHIQNSSTVNVPLCLNEDYSQEASRILSFLKFNWPKMANEVYAVGALELARSGFYCVGIDDAARCNFCRLEIKGWEQGDEADSEHRKWNPSCLFLQNDFSYVHNIPLFGSYSRLSVENDCAQLSYGSEEINFPSSSSLILSNPKHANYKDYDERLKTFSNWAKCMRQKPQQLSESGFFYTGTGDRVVCYQCGGGLMNWDIGDDPKVEHIVWFETCEFVQKKYTQEYIKKVKEQNLKINRNQAKNGSTTQPLNNDAMKNSNISQNTETVCQKLLCKVCLNKTLEIIFLPCRHMATCTDCAVQLIKCPICRKDAEAHIRAYLP